jgi:hypothetical protein
MRHGPYFAFKNRAFSCSMNHKTSSAAWASKLSLSPRGLRTRVELEVMASRADGRSFPAIIADISRDGCQLRSDTPFKVGELISLNHEVLGELLGQVRWACAGRAGLQFLRPL